MDANNGINIIKELEYQRLLEAPKVEIEKLVHNTAEGEDMSDLDSDFEWIIMQLNISLEILQKIHWAWMVVY
jgi:hypothetical protein